MPGTLENDITGIILVGGKSRRMGIDKAFLKVDGIPIFERVLSVFRESFRLIALIGDREERFARYGCPVWPDIYPGSSLGGLYTGLQRAATDYVFVASCDLPFPSSGILCHLASLRHGFDAVVVSTDDGYEPLFALYAKGCLPAIKELLDSGRYCAYAYYPRVNVRFVPYREIAHLDPDGNAFLNVNTPEEFANTGGEL